MLRYLKKAHITDFLRINLIILQVKGQGNKNKKRKQE